jgi:Di-haem oxidoreductase, putative peroxidase
MAAVDSKWRRAKVPGPYFFLDGPSKVKLALCHPAEKKGNTMGTRLRSVTTSVIALLASSLLALADIADAQLTDVTQTTPNVPGGAIGKSLEQQIGTGQDNIFTPGSSFYIIARDPARAIRRGRQLFQRKFTADQGVGPRVNDNSTGNIQNNPAFGAGLVDSCAGCHGRPRGAAGFGGDVVTRPDSRDAPHLFGLGLQEMLADEITQDLRAIRTNAVQAATQKQTTVTLPLTSKGIKYGFIRALANGTVDTSLVQGVDPDLRVRPFFAHGGEFSIRAFAVGAFKDEMGLEAPDPFLCAASDPVHPITTRSPAGMVFNPALDKIKRPPVCDPNQDGDSDGVVNEIDPALLDHLEFYLSNYFKPGLGRLTSRARHGTQVMEKIGCTVCHVQDMPIRKDRRVADVETEYDPQRGIFNRLFATLTPLFGVVNDGQQFPQLPPLEGPFLVRNIFTDFKRHDLGPAFHERQYNGTLVQMFMTEPLWGVGSTPPYGHDGRSVNLEEVILRHGGEAQASRNTFAVLSDDQKQAVLEFLSALIIFPPDDTASNLNPGNPGTTNPQSPSEHGSIALSVLFQIPSEGPE